MRKLTARETAALGSRFAIRNVRPRSWAWVHFYLALGVGLSTGIEFVTPAVYNDVLGQPFISIWTGLCTLGALAAIVGILLTYGSRQLSWVDLGIIIEFAGVLLMCAGPLAHLADQIGLMVAPPPLPPGAPPINPVTQRYALAWLDYAVLTAIGVRAVVVAPRWTGVIRSRWRK